MIDQEPIIVLNIMLRVGWRLFRAIEGTQDNEFTTYDRR